ncbi:thiamine phosphate synthase [Spirosoma sordidisoli]|uniref:Thiamine phosphate synthase n=1 Tax=Spirosoma sordidisoli TaxID=2502893 RepID=A0A4Q2UV50_9BACT|nr:thiamine phosphate synthase [Spirosoma sordidisoli]RYC71700.1 thiamine phosphate synthase [Spirosoma sordidisoli]
MSAPSFLLVGITDGSPQSQDIPTLAALLANGLDFLYWRSAVQEASPDRLPPDKQASVLLSASRPDAVRPPFRWHVKEADRQWLTGREAAPFSTSIHHLSEWANLAGRVSMVFYSPVFASISKPGYGPSVSLDTIGRQLLALREQHTQLPLLIGLGGITAKNVALVRQAGFDGAALMGGLWQQPDPVGALTEIKASVGR